LGIHRLPTGCFAYPQGSFAYNKIMISAWRITPIHNAKLQSDASSLDGITRQLPDGYYSTFRTFSECTRVLGFSEHLRRLYDPAAAPDVGESFLRRQLFALLDSYRPDEARVRLIMTKQGQAYIVIEPLKPLPREVYERGVRVETTELQREHPRLKSTAFIGRSDSERRHIAEVGIFEALLVKDQKILEGMTSNFFYVMHAEKHKPRVNADDAILYTAHEDILLGVTRKTVIELAQGRGVQVEYKPLHLAQLSTVDEAFITSSSRGVVPVMQIDQVIIGQGRPGPITNQLSTAYDQYVMDHAERIWPDG
jgi:branched-chain amino acid aminotransferase